MGSAARSGVRSRRVSPDEMDGLLGAIGRLELTVRQMEQVAAQQQQVIERQAAELEALKAGGER